jgi:hypothetical protein
MWGERIEITTSEEVTVYDFLRRRVPRSLPPGKYKLTGAFTWSWGVFYFLEIPWHRDEWGGFGLTADRIGELRLVVKPIVKLTSD